MADKKHHILVISQYFYPESFRINDICREWVKRGYEVTVVTGIPNYPQGKFYQGYNWFQRRKEDYKGVYIIRLPLVPRGSNALMLILNYAFFVCSGFFWKLFTKIKVDKVFIFEVSPMTQALVGVWYAKKRKIPCYIYVQDLWPENVEIVTGIRNKAILSMIDKMVDYIYLNCDKIFATSPSFVKRLEERTSVYENYGAGKQKHNGKRNSQDKNIVMEGKSKVIYWPQYAEDFYRPAQKKALQDVSDEDAFKIVFTGNIGYAQGLEILPKVATVLKEKGIPCKFLMIGDGRYREKFEEELKEKKVEEMFDMLGWKRPEEIPGYLALGDMAFLSFMKNELFSMTIPAKLQSYMACGIPILAVAEGETARVIREANCGVVSAFDDIEGIVKSISFYGNRQKELVEMGKRGREYSEQYFDKKKLMDIMDGYILSGK